MIVGIDLGTTNSLAAVWRDGQAVLIPNALGQVLTPSCVSLDDQGQVLVGAAARDRLLTQPRRTAAAFKRYMGTDRRLTLADREFRPEELSALVLKSLKADAEAFLGEPVTEAIITVPAYFNDTQRKATRIAGELAGLKVERLLNEPTAAALAYGLHHADPESQFLVFDLGGGTFDVSILELFSGVMEVRATAGDNYLGGEDFAGILVDAFLAQHAGALRLDPKRLSPEQAARLRSEAERVKRELSHKDPVLMSCREGELEAQWSVTADAFERLAANLLLRLRTPVERALRDARINAASLHQVVLVGGATRMPIVHRLVAKMFGRFPNREINPDEAIAMGAAVQAGLKARDAALSEVVLTDVSPYSLGIETTEEYAAGQYRPGVFMPVIERNTVIPASRCEVISPLHDYQTMIELRIYQGESRSVQENVLLGRLNVPLPKKPRGQQQVEVRFTYDVNGLLLVEAKILATGTVEKLLIEQSPGAMSQDDIRESLGALEQLRIHPREQSENVAMLERLKRLYEQHLGERREWVSQQLSAFMTVVERQNPRDIAHLRLQLGDVLDQFEDTPLG
ncbi:molecular chaperone HscC [Solimonas sp. K1W22B-7]|uniref:Hsp70 family protein n=1 Tax=Solimonas sp. K1W22B-7 TaxID=2303331 RepID=UPI000E32E526|nr:molecular chaperone HscC [Solimonas sp. K1W22B-7]AXQ31165.1 molecular chaperone HscC [Solimonas sp. K1W22B-7]